MENIDAFHRNNSSSSSNQTPRKCTNYNASHVDTAERNWEQHLDGIGNKNVTHGSDKAIDAWTAKLTPDAECDNRIRLHNAYEAIRHNGTQQFPKKISRFAFYIQYSRRFSFFFLSDLSNKSPR